MDVKVERGFLMLADITGYTSFMAKGERGHAEPVAREFLELVSSRLSPLLKLLEVEGDALFVFSPSSRIERGETLLELVESTYGAFRDRITALQRHTNCGCVACNSIGSLDLKFFIHFGEYVPQRIAGVFKLVGSEVNLLHRLVKNHVTERTGWKAYAMLTEASRAQLNIPPESLHKSIETYEHLGDVVTHNLDLHSRYRELAESRRVVVSAEEADVVLERDFRCAPPVLWEMLNDPHKRGEWVEGTTWTAHTLPSGRTGPGASNHCAHGKGVVVEQIVDWRPFDYYSTTVNHGMITVRDTLVLTPVSNATHLSHRILMDMPLPRLAIRPLAKLIVSRVMKIEKCWDRIEKLIAARDFE
jgi:hypothetical protein